MAAFPSIRTRFNEALAWFLGRVKLTAAEGRELADRYKGQAFWLAGAAQLRMVQDVFDALARSLDSGLGFAAFKKDVLTKLAAAWSKRGGRLETIWINNVQKAHNAGRHAQHTTPGNKAMRPFWQYDSVLDGRTSNICRPRDGVVLPADDPWWRGNYPPLHHRCRSGVRALTKRQGAGKVGPLPDDLESSQGGFGSIPGGPADRDPFDPTGIDRGLLDIWDEKKAAAA